MSAATAALAVIATRGRRNAEPATDESPFEVDRERILHCAAFRRLVQKTQVFVTHEGDHFRTRLTHTLEVAAVARRIARWLGLCEVLSDAIALAHDLGHPPFGHAGEKELAEQMRGHGGFEHNLQSLRVVDYLEHPYPPWRGLNLTFELREGLVKHCTPYDRPHDSGDAADAATRELLAAGPLPPLEGQVASVADQIAYSVHDVEDGLLQGMLDEAALGGSALWREAAEPVRRVWPLLPIAAVRRPILDGLTQLLVSAVVSESERRAAALPSGAEVRGCGEAIIGFSVADAARLAELQRLLLSGIYRHHQVVRMDSKARRLIRELFAAYLAEPSLLPPRYFGRIAEQGAHRVICDYIAGMTDRYCRTECARLFDPERFD